MKLFQDGRDVLTTSSTSNKTCCSILYGLKTPEQCNGYGVKFKFPVETLRCQLTVVPLLRNNSEHVVHTQKHSLVLAKVGNAFML